MGFAVRDDAQLGHVGQRRAALPQGREPRADAHGARRGDAGRGARATCDLAIDAGLDLLRVHAHVARPELYDAADEAGLLLWQDMPLQWGYARSVRKQAVRQARKAVDLLGHHPSIALWCGHNEPVAVDVEQSATAGSEEVRAEVRCRPAAPDVEPQHPRPRGEVGLRAGRRHAAGDRALGRAPAPAASSTAPTRTSTSGGTRGTSATSRASAPRCRAWPGS